MRHALSLAHKASEQGEVPVGAVLVKDDQLISEGWNQPILQHDPTAHAEIMAMRHAAKKLENYRLPGTTLYITIEPCSMCAGAIVHARIKRVVFGGSEPRAGAAGSVINLLQNPQFNHQTEVTSGVLSEECGQLLKDFFLLKRQLLKKRK
ncbi:MAG: tRNA adenosine(34) deaminase TadA [gamma proteobacterium symbiont of Bathyaustriella thionipta]|nr:tRNA adenosine(34) deaminase TadA [gamma proteobacterium symbiont of Bathyaustriella thionipta]MCU7950962.1 tRNA adenosine(34) deaminase TadA [gamma proteobacterium symbiont of Bathyaustriella thionipta]MCU7953191.1 tRNA adenosine(34) deaminase TadA [gamma proteobacterium symbiont of Bathyaustriella thionipta]MCU7957458.1 tRNA adenosine(34) deaminase TadA [gamma proteobacterium symbiont of Bathyaustriella thionipta]MCU7968404.1 tRNA adenosine(34) deaminase TadA [gamma proteobacterium symbion